MSKDQQIVNFTVGNVEYGVPVSQVKEVRDIQKVTPVPGAPPYVDGVTNLRGQIITILDLSKRLNLSGEGGGRDKVIVIETHSSTVGVVVDTVTEVSDIPEEDIQDNLVRDQSQDYIIGIGKQDGKLVVVLDLLKIVNDATSNIDMSPMAEMMVTA
ncbi:purine-binding chemotaxis protein CheW [Candidatus Bathyarchaeota archaeon]|nr:purine-binding chemotaxis protein CheW [Candidatus Bathyarchaeota archaeon]